MKVLLYTYEMVPGVERLMPWRTLVEVARNAPDNYEVSICSAQNLDEPREYDGVKIYSISYGTDSLKHFVEDGKWEVVYYPITYRQGLKDTSDLESIKARKIAYVPGGLCPLSGSLKLISSGEAKRAIPYLLDTITPHSWIAKKLQRVGFESIVCQSPLTTLDAQQSGWKTAVCALPGNADTCEINFDGSHFESLGLKEEKYLLFSGAPAPTRGATLAIKAFDKVASKLPDTKMLMLMRRDVSSDFTEFDKTVSEIRHKDRFIICYDKLTYGQLLYYFKSAWAVLLPFLIIPSEIPLTYFEVMGLGTPVITFANGGTTDYLRNGLLIAKHRTIASLADAIIILSKNAGLRNSLSNNAKSIMSKHPSWKETSQKWLSVL